jgi:hypothetical protein
LKLRVSNSNVKVTEREVKYFKNKTLKLLNKSEAEFCEFHGVKSLKDYIMKQKKDMIEQYLEDQEFLLDPYIKRLVYEALCKIPLYDLDKILDEFTEIKEVDASECFSVETSTPLTEKWISERKYKAAYKEATKPRWIILLYKGDFHGRSKEYGLFTIAHELAHKRLKHTIRKVTSLKRENLFKHEDEANKLAEKWGFKKPKNFKPPNSLLKRLGL